jgi:hypothetical protein
LAVCALILCACAQRSQSLPAGQRLESDVAQYQRLDARIVRDANDGSTASDALYTDRQEQERLLNDFCAAYDGADKAALDSDIQHFEATHPWC